MSRAMTTGKPFIPRGPGLTSGNPVTNGGLVWNGSSWVSQLMTDDNVNLCEWQPQDNGFAFWNGDPMDRAATGLTMVSQTVYMAKVKTPTAKTITTVGCVIGTAGSTLTSGQNLIAVCDPNGVQLGSTSASQHTAWSSGNGYKAATVGSFVTTAGSFVYVLFLSVGTTPPIIQVKDGNLAGGTNANLAAGAYRGATIASSVTAFSFPYTLSNQSSVKQMILVGLL